ncbi:LysM peptidoglycan-binding domain-containing protein [Kurthia sibirica]|uniref:LysM peptidoglycan-binding domain-containing protein n=1 Tax=Kurthia sibirica TaxID=202750 RepID=UPI00116DC2CF|nr:LysM peptidoglycan-binding domain-containing protein [Kurthia sibirica]GEK34979.1 hypothetical protein KSI01_25120 [Kurthia sibirica]
MKYGKYISLATATLIGLSSISTIAQAQNSIVQTNTNQNQLAFIETIGQSAMVISAHEGIYASIMIAQAILESNYGNSSLSQNPNYNLFGMKGSYEGNSARFTTKEDDGKGKISTSKANFRQYANYEQSLYDYAKLVTKGTTYNSMIYAGIWKSNAATYVEASEFLQGRYATDSTYAKKLQRLIQRYDLTRFDKESTEILPVKNNQIIRIQKEDTVEGIALAYDLTVEQLLALNNRQDPHLKVGEKFVVPNNKKRQPIVQKKVKRPAPKPIVYRATKYYRVKAGDSLTSIAKKYRITTTQLKKWNDLTTATLTKNKRLIVDVERNNKKMTTVNKQQKLYRIQEEDTLASIASLSNTTEQALMELNHLLTEFVYVGQVIKLSK